MTIKYRVVGALSTTGNEVTYEPFPKLEDAQRYANFYFGDLNTPRPSHRVGSVIVVADTSTELLDQLIKSGDKFRVTESVLTTDPYIQRFGRSFRRPLKVDISVLTEGLKLPEGFIGFITGSGDAAGTRRVVRDEAAYEKALEQHRKDALAKTVQEADFAGLEARILSRMLNEDSAERVSLEEMFKRYGMASYGSLSEGLIKMFADALSDFSSETPEAKCNCMICAISDEMTELELRRAPAKFSAESATESPSNATEQLLEDPTYGTETPASVKPVAESATVGNGQIVPVAGKSYYVKLADFDQAQLIKAKVLYVSDKVVELEFIFREQRYIAAYQLNVKCVKFLEEVIGN